MKTEIMAAVAMDRALRFSDKHCAQCNKLTLHRGAKCGLCGFFTYIHGRPAGRWNAKGDTKRTAIVRKRFGVDKREASKRQAAASRLKFETKT